MPFRDPDKLQRDIVGAIDYIERFTADMDFTGFSEDPKTVSAVERQLQIVSEAATRLGAEAGKKCPGIAWPEIRGIGNWLRHAYDAIELPTIWETVKNDLPPLKAAVLRALGTAPAEPHVG